jgi:hypothetical protein
MNPRGDVIVVYRSGDTLRTVRRPVGGSWQRSRLLLRGYIFEAAVTLGEKGVATVFAGTYKPGFELEKMIAFRSDPRGDWTPGKRVGYGFDPNAVVGPNGAITLGWWALSPCIGNDCGISVMTHAAHRGWSKRRNVLPVQSQPPLVDLAVDDDGHVYLAAGGQIFVSRRPGGPWRVERVFSSSSDRVRVAASGHGWAIAVSSGHPVKGSVVATVRRPDGTWTPLWHMPRATIAPWPTVTRRGRGAVSAEISADHPTVGVAHFAPRTGWTPLQGISRGERPRVLSGPSGAALLFFLGSSSNASGLEATFRPHL